MVITMLYDFIIIDKNQPTPLYTQIYSSIRRAVENKSLAKGTKLPSVRQLSNSLLVSKTTVITAYDQLCVEGYIKNKPQSGYYVEAQFEKAPEKTSISNAKADYRFFEYDFSGKSIDEKIINIDQWRRYVKEVMNTPYLLTSYGEPQGETVLRNALQKYALGVRSVNTNANNIIVGAGTQSLLYILCLLIGNNKKIAISKDSYIQAEIIFSNLSYNLEYYTNDEFGVEISSLEKIKPDIILINPNFIEENGLSIPINRRLELIKWAEKNNALIIEDDYNGELRYSTHPLPCVQNYGIENTVYLGSFSKILLPSVRISYMVLPDKLIDLYNQKKDFINQTASKAEQTALAKYLENRKLDTHLRKARRIYLEKSKIITNSVFKYFGNKVDILFNETSLYISLKFKNKINFSKLTKSLAEQSVCIMQKKNNDYSISLSFSGIETEKIENGIKIIYQQLKNDI